MDTIGTESELMEALINLQIDVKYLSRFLNEELQAMSTFLCRRLYEAADLPKLELNTFVDQVKHEMGNLSRYLVGQLYGYELKIHNLATNIN